MHRQPRGTTSLSGLAASEIPWASDCDHDMRTWCCFPVPTLWSICYPLEGTQQSWLSCWRSRCVGHNSPCTHPQLSAVFEERKALQTSQLPPFPTGPGYLSPAPLFQGQSGSPAVLGNAQHTIHPVPTPQTLPLHPQHPRTQAPPRI